MPKEEERVRHPSFGMIGITRTYGNGRRRLFGSVMDQHDCSMFIRIYPGERVHALSVDRYIATTLTPIIEVELSPAQFAEFLTTHNVGMGVPCTVRSLNGKQVEGVPDDDAVERERIRDGFKDDMKQLADKMRDIVNRANAILDGSGTLTKDKRNELKGYIHKIVQHVESNIPFVLDQFERATDRVTSAAKAEADAFLTNVLHRAGLDALANKLKNPVEGTGPALPEGESKP